MQSEQEECLRTLADDIFYGLGNRTSDAGWSRFSYAMMRIITCSRFMMGRSWFPSFIWSKYRQKCDIERCIEAMLDGARKVLQQVYGYPEFREGQKNIITNLLRRAEIR